MKKNLGRTDRAIRIIIAVGILYFMDQVSGNVQIILGVTAAALLFTALNGFCLLYRPFGLDTRRKKEA